MSVLPSPYPGHASPDQEPRPVDSIRTILKQDVSEVLRANLPALALVPADKVYDRVLDDPALLHQAFTLLRQRPALFAAFLRTRQSALPTNDSDPLWCGRTLAEAVALIVRACARRYFRRRAPKPRRSMIPAPRPSLLRSIGISFGLVSPPKRPRRAKPINAGERLFQAMREFLQFDWQVPLIPAYAGLSPDMVTKLGPRILEYRRSEQIQVLTDPVAAGQAAEGKVPLMLDDASRLMMADGTGINAEVLWNVGQKMHIGLLFPDWDTNEMRRAVSMVSATAPAALALLAPALGADVRAFTLFLFTAYNKLGTIGYKQVFGPNGQIWVVRTLADRAKRESPLAPSLEQMKLAMERLLDGAALTDAVKPSA